MDDILKLLGSPSEVDRQRQPGFILFEWRGRAFRVWQDRDTGRVTSIRVYYVRGVQTGYRTEQGLTIGTHEAEGRRLYGTEGCLLRVTPNFREFSWPQVGIFFLISADPPDPTEIHTRVRELGIRRIGADPPGDERRRNPVSNRGEFRTSDGPVRDQPVAAPESLRRSSSRRSRRRSFPTRDLGSMSLNSTY